MGPAGSSIATRAHFFAERGEADAPTSNRHRHMFDRRRPQRNSLTHHRSSVTSSWRPSSEIDAPAMRGDLCFITCAAACRHVRSPTLLGDVVDIKRRRKNMMKRRLPCIWVPPARAASAVSGVAPCRKAGAQRADRIATPSSDSIYVSSPITFASGASDGGDGPLPHRGRARPRASAR